MGRPKKVQVNNDNNNYITITINKNDEILFKKPYACVTCGKRFAVQKGNFSFSQSGLYKNNNNYLPTCISCLEKLYDIYKDQCGEHNAIQRICLHYDIYYDENLAESSINKATANQSVMRYYIKNCNLNQYRDKTYDTFLNEDISNIKSREDYETVKASGKIGVSKAVIDRFGIGLGTDEDYRVLDNHYKMLKTANPNCDSNQEIFIKSLCNLYMLSMRALRDNNMKGYVDANAEYTKTFKQAGLKTTSDDNKNADDCWGLWMEQISKYTPEEYYKDKSLYRDFDKIGDFFNRFVLRPLKNLLNKENVRDEEFNVGDEVD